MNNNSPSLGLDRRGEVIPASTIRLAYLLGAGYGLLVLVMVVMSIVF